MTVCAETQKTNMTTHQPGQAMVGELLKIESDIFTAIKSKDTKILGEILADDFIYLNPVSGEQTKAEFLAAIDSFTIKIVSLWSDNMKVKVYDEVAILTGTQKAKTEDAEGKEELSAVAFVDVFVRRGGKWELALAHGVDLPVF
jgi:ketosteroid isomerase-like protein